VSRKWKNWFQNEVYDEGETETLDFLSCSRRDRDLARRRPRWFSRPCASFWCFTYSRYRVQSRLLCVQMYYVKNGPQNGGFEGKRGVYLNFGLRPPKGQILARNRLFRPIFREGPCGRLGCISDLENRPPPKKK